MVSVLVVSRGRVARWRAGLESVARQGYPSLDVHVLANGCSETAAVVAAEFPHVHLAEVPKNLGSAPGRNRIAREGRGEFLLFLDDDGELRSSDIVGRVVETAMADPRAGVVSMGLLNADDNEPTGWRRSLGQLEFTCYHAGFAGGACLVRAEAFRDTGGYCEAFTGPSEEFDLTVRLYDAGWAVVHFPKVFFHHYVDKDAEHWRVLVSRGYKQLQYIIWRLYPSPWHVLASLKAVVTQLYIDVRHHFGLHLAAELFGSVRWAARGLRDREPVARRSLERMYYAKYFRVSDWETLERAPSGLLRRLPLLRMRRKMRRVPKLPIPAR